MVHRGVTIGWDVGSADDVGSAVLVLAFVDSLSDEEAAQLKFVQFESDFPGVGPVIQAGWTAPPPWRFRNKGQIPPVIGGVYPSLLDPEGRVVKPRQRRR
jgi:hypothetical protein